MFRKADEEKGPLEVAIVRRRPDLVALLVELGIRVGHPCDPDYSPWYYAAVAVRDTEIAAALLPAGLEREVYRAVESRDLDRLVELRDALGPEVGPAGRCRWAIHLACLLDEPAMAGWLLDLGADPEHELVQGSGIRPLHYAAIAGSREACEVLLERGADPTARDHEHDGPPAGWAAHHDHEELATWLRDRVRDGA